MLQYRDVAFEIKAVLPAERIIEGYASIHSTVDRVADIVDRKAFDRCLSTIDVKTIGVYIGHDVSQLPRGICIEAKVDDIGLFTRTLVKPTPEGDELLGTATFLHENGQKLGMSIGYQTQKASYEKAGTKTVRRLLDVELGEYSFAGAGMIAHPDALTVAVKTLADGIGALSDDDRKSLIKALSEGTDTAGGFVADKKATLDTDERDALDESDFAYVDSEGGKHLPIQDAKHVRAALARFNQTSFDSDADKKKAWAKILKKAKSFDIDVSDDSMPKAPGVATTESKALGVSYETIGREVADMARDQLDDDDDDADPQDGRRNYCYPTATYADQVIVCYDDWDGDADDGTFYYAIPYSLGTGGHVASIGTPVPVEQTWTPDLSAMAKTIVGQVAVFERKASGKRMTKAGLGQVHSALDAIHDIHDQHCDDDSCIYQKSDDDVKLLPMRSILRALDAKVGSTMSASHLGQFHGAIGSLRKLHDSQCKDEKCPHRMPADDSGADDQKDDGEKDSTAKTVDVLTPRSSLAELIDVSTLTTIDDYEKALFALAPATA